MGDAKSHTRRLKLEDMNVNIYFLLIRWVPASLQRTTAIAPVARGRHDRKSAVSLVIIITWLMGSIQLKPCMVKHITFGYEKINKTEFANLTFFYNYLFC
jgi:hypothetical protein